MEILFIHDSFIKSFPVQAANLRAEDKIAVRKGDRLDIVDCQPSFSKHVRITLADSTKHYIFVEHVSIEGNLPENDPRDTEPPPAPRSGAFRLPEFTSTFYLPEPIIPKGNFTWAEATRSGSRIPKEIHVVEGILSIASELQEIRKFLGDRPITVTSWYRPVDINLAAGGARGSFHTRGNAVDFAVQGLTSDQVYARLDPWWGARGGLAAGDGFTHVDSRRSRARWSYPRRR